MSVNILKNNMFSGIVELKQKAKKIVKTKDGLRLSFPIPNKWKTKIGESINIDGICTTVEKLSEKEFSVFYMPETLSKTTLSNLKNDHEFNFEKCLTLNSLIGGHLVTGHIDTMVKVLKIEEEEESKVITFTLPSEFAKYLIYKGSICINGVSLTVVEVLKNSFKVSLIPHTLKVTNLGSLKKDDIVNIEVDMIAKYLEKIVRK